MSYSLAARMAAAAAVGRGAALLDAKMPGWWHKINLRTLDLANGNQCVLGQVFAEPRQVSRWRRLGYSTLAETVRAYGRVYSRSQLTQRICTANYDLGRAVLMLDDKQIIEAGFNAGTHGDDVYVSYSLLDNAWWRLVDDRQRADLGVGR
jgi:hypothetical protein